MDQIDKKLLGLLQQNARMPLKQLAAEVGLSSPATSTRITHLEESGVLCGFHAKVNSKALGYALTAFVSLEANPAKMEPLYSLLREYPNVLECHSVTGQSALLMKVTFPSTMELDLFVCEIQKYGKTNTSIVFSTILERTDFPVY